MTVQVLGNDYQYVNAPTRMGANLYDTVVDWTKNTLFGSPVPTTPPAVPSFMDQYGIYVVGGVALVGVFASLKLLKGKRRARRR